MVGDSLTDAAEWSELFPGKAIANRGIGGDTTQGALERLDAIAATEAQTAFIMLGYNDFAWGREVEETFADYEQIVTQLRDSGISQIYLQSTLFAGEGHQESNQKTARLNTLLSELAAERDGVTFIDLNQHLAPQAQLDVQYSRDDVHLNGLGYRVWADAIATYMNMGEQ